MNEWCSLLPPPQPRYRSTPVVTPHAVYYIGALTHRYVHACIIGVSLVFLFISYIGGSNQCGPINTIDSWSLVEHCWKSTRFSTPPGRWLTNFAAEYVCDRIWLVTPSYPLLYHFIDHVMTTYALYID